MFRKPISRKRGTKTNKPIKRIGKKTLEWSKVRKELVQDFTARGITSCEIRLIGCTGNLYLSLAHSKKRSQIKNEEELKEVCVCCSSCHSFIEFKLSREEMYEIVTATIKERK